MALKSDEKAYFNQGGKTKKKTILMQQYKHRLP